MTEQEQIGEAELVGRELAAMSLDAGQISGFLAGMKEFFTTAQAYEQVAIGTLVEARALVAPTTSDDDAFIQRFIVSTKQTIKDVERHWTITALVSQLHRKLTAKRELAVKPLKDAAQIAQLHHDGYLERAERARKAEQARVEREAREAERVEREAEAARLKAEADAAEENSPALSAKEQTFVDLYVSTADAPRAATRAGYVDGFKAATRLLSRPKIVAAIQAAQTAAEARVRARAVTEAPSRVDVPIVKADVQKVGTDRGTWSAEVLDEAEFIRAVIGGKHGIPVDCLTVDRVRLNQLARAMGSRMNDWPGVQAKRKNSTI